VRYEHYPRSRRAWETNDFQPIFKRNLKIGAMREGVGMRMACQANRCAILPVERHSLQNWNSLFREKAPF